MNKRLLDAIVREAPARLDAITGQRELPDEERGACCTYSRILAEVLGEFGIKAEVRAVYLIAANRLGIEYLQGKITAEEAERRGGKYQIWGDVYGTGNQRYQHAVCYIPSWDVVVDLAMARRGSGLVPVHSYWAKIGEFPWWLVEFRFEFYFLTYRGYVNPDKVKRAKEVIRGIIKREGG